MNTDTAFIKELSEKIAAKDLKLREYELAIEELKNTVDSCRLRIYQLEKSKLSINQVIQRKDEFNLSLQIVRYYPTENGVVIEVE